MATVDDIYWLPAHPGEGTENRAVDYRSVVGAPAGRGGITAGRLGLDTVVLGMRGDDVYGTVLDELFRDEPVTVRFGVRRGPSQHSCVLVAADTASRTTIWVPSPQAEDDLLSALAEEVPRASVVLVDTSDDVLMHAALGAAREHGVRVVVDTGDYPLPAPDVLKGVGFVIAPEAFAARAAEGTDLPTWAVTFRESLDLGVLGVTQGAEGGFWVDVEGVHRWDAVPSDAVDTCGAGDAFHGGFAWALARGLPTDAAFTVAASVASRHVSAYGNDGLPTYGELAARAALPVNRLTQ